MKTRLQLTILITAILSSSAFAIPTQPGVGLTIYNDNFAVVKERRHMDFQKGTNTVKFTDVASAIDPTSVNFKSLSDPDAVKILEQNYDYDLVNTASLLKSYIDNAVALRIKGSGSTSCDYFSGKLRSALGNDLIIETSEGMRIVSRNEVSSIELAGNAKGLVTKPTLVWLANAKKTANELCQVTYTTNSIGWTADYTAVLNETDDKLDLSGWVTINNQSGATYKDATIKLIAGDVKRIQPPASPRRYKAARSSMMMADSSAAFEEKPFMEYHLYTLGRKSTINNRQVKQIQLIEPATDVDLKKLHVYEVSTNQRLVKSTKVQTKLEFKNTQENNLGIALPKGKVRVFKKDPADKMLEFVGEDKIDHTAKKETLSLYIGDAFDIVAEQKITNAKHTSHYQRLTREVQLRNRKDKQVTVFVDEICPKGRNMNISDASIKHENKDAYTARFKLTIPADSKQTLTYTTTQTW
jgi:hypothetical protein